MNLPKISILLFFSFFLSSCIPTTIVTSFVVGKLATREKSLSHTRNDISIEYLLKNKFISDGIFFINPLVEDGRVFLMGRVSQEKAADIAKAIRLSWKESGVIEVINEVQIEQDSDMISPFSFIKDTMITLVIKGRLAFMDDVKYVNYKFKTINAVVYIMGIAQNESELQKVSETIASTNMVKKVISHAVHINDQRKK